MPAFCLILRIHPKTHLFVFFKRTFSFCGLWLYSRRKGESVLPLGFWLISLSGSAIIITYALLRGNMLPLILGHLTGIFTYSRNVMIELKNRKK